MINEDSFKRLENNYISIVIDQVHGKIVGLWDKQQNEEWLWSREAKGYGKTFDDCWTGGIDLLFPIDEEATEKGSLYRDHGICWGDNWKLLQSKADSCKLCLSEEEVSVIYDIELNDNTVLLKVKLENHSSKELPYLFRWHCAFGLPDIKNLCLSANKEDFMQCYGEEKIIDNEYYSQQLTLDYNLGETEYDMHFISLEKGKVVLKNRKRKELILEFEREKMPVLTVFASRGKWNDCNVLVVEPSSGKYSEYAKLERGNQLKHLKQTETIEYQLSISLGQWAERG